MLSTVYVVPPEMPVWEAPQGIRYDFLDGARVYLPEREGGVWFVTLKDVDSGLIVYQNEIKTGVLKSKKRYFVRFEIKVERRSDAGDIEPVFEHVLDLRDRDVVVQIPVGTIGDVFAWFPYVSRFAETNKAKVTCVLSPVLIPLFEATYPELRLMTAAQIEAENVMNRAYANYHMGLFFTDAENTLQPTDFRHVGLHKTAAYILGVDPAEIRPRIALEDDTRPIEEPYVCIAVQSSAQCKYWNNPTGWLEVVRHIKARGYRVICIDQKPVNGVGYVWNRIPHGAEDETGDRPLAERARRLKHAAFFVGLSSGLSWLAWAMETPVVMISGFTHPTNEFETPYRVINWHACNSCWNDPREMFDHNDFFWCPRHANTSRQFECTRLITADQVVKIIEPLLNIE